MAQEDYVGFEVAKLLTEKGFDEECSYRYVAEPDYRTPEFVRSPIGKGSRYLYNAPSHQMAMKWLRIKHNILLFLLPAQENGKLVYLVEVWTWNEEEGIYESTYAPMPRKEPEKAVEAALKYCLENLI